MEKDELDLLEHRIQTINKKIDKGGLEEEDRLNLSVELGLLNSEKRYILEGGARLKSDDNIGDLDFLLKKKKSILSDITKNLEFLPPDHVEMPKFNMIRNTLQAQSEYLAAKRRVILENRSLSELSRYIRLAEEDGVEIVASHLEHEAELQYYKPEKTESRKKEFTVNFQKIALILAVFFFLVALYGGISWRKTPYDKTIIRSYVVGRAHYLNGNELFVKGDYQGGVNDYTIAAAFFNRASDEAYLAAASKRGKMNIYFDYKGKFFQQWEKISLKMAESSKAFKSNDPEKGALYANEASSMTGMANSYNQFAEEAWSLL